MPDSRGMGPPETIGAGDDPHSIHGGGELSPHKVAAPSSPGSGKAHRGDTHCSLREANPVGRIGRTRRRSSVGEWPRAKIWSPERGEVGIWPRGSRRANLGADFCVLLSDYGVTMGSCELRSLHGVGVGRESLGDDSNTRWFGQVGRGVSSRACCTFSVWGGS